VLRDVGLGHDPATGAIFIDYKDAPNLSLLHQPAAVLDVYFRRDHYARAGHAIARRQLQRILAFGHGPAADVAISYDSYRPHILPVLNHRDFPAVALDHQPGDLLQVSVQRTTGRISRHNVFHLHDCPPYQNSERIGLTKTIMPLLV
jgi:hypothetical protein